MPITIAIPEDISFHKKHIPREELGHQTSLNEEKARDVDWKSFYKCLLECPKRTIIFYEELLSGYVIHTCSTEEKLPSKTVYLTLNSTFDRVPDATLYGTKVQTPKPPVINVIDPQTPESPKNESEGLQVKEPKLIAVADMLWQGQHTDSNGTMQTVSIWKFLLNARWPELETSGHIDFNVSFTRPPETNGKKSRNGSVEKPSISLQIVDLPIQNSVQNRLSEELENLLEELNHGVSKKSSIEYELLYTGPKSATEDPPKPPPHPESKVSDEIVEQEDSNPGKLLDSPKNNGFSQIAISAPIQLKLRTTRPVCRSNVLLMSLSIEPPDQLVNFAATQRNERYVLYILGVDAEFTGGRITQLDNSTLPRRCDLNDVLIVTYKLENDETSIEPGSNFPPTAKPVSITVRVRIEKRGVSDTTGREIWHEITQAISPTWAPILDLEGGASTKTLPAKAMLSQLPFRPKSTHLKPVQSGLSGPISYLKRTSPIKNFASGSALSASNSPFSSLQGCQQPGSLNLNRSIAANKSSPILSVSRGGIMRRKPQKSNLSQPGAIMNIAVNLAGETLSFSVLSGLTLTFSGPPKVDTGHVTAWKVQAINQTKRVLKLTLKSNPTRKNVSMYLHISPYFANGTAPSSSQHTLPSSSSSSSEGKEAPIIRNRLHLLEQYNLLKPEKTGVVLLSNDIGLGTLEPGQVFESEFLFVAVAKGIFNLNGLRVVDSSTGEFADVGKFIDVYAV